MSFLPSTNKGGHLAGIYLVNAVCSLRIFHLTGSVDCTEMIRLLQHWSWFILGLSPMSLAIPNGSFVIAFLNICSRHCVL